jgi:hypothetical protein
MGSLSPALWNVQLTKKTAGNLLHLHLHLHLHLISTLCTTAPLAAADVRLLVTGQPERIESADAQESDCRVVLWDAKRKLIATIDSSELRWYVRPLRYNRLSLMFCYRYMDFKEAPLPCDILSADSHRRACSAKGQKGNSCMFCCI